jgi:hypothetical protein
MQLLPDVDVLFFRSIVVLSSDEQFLDCATVAFSERYSYGQEYEKLQTLLRII